MFANEPAESGAANWRCKLKYARTAAARVGPAGRAVSDDMARDGASCGRAAAAQLHQCEPLSLLRLGTSLPDTPVWPAAPEPRNLLIPLDDGAHESIKQFSPRGIAGLARRACAEPRPAPLDRRGLVRNSIFADLISERAQREWHTNAPARGLGRQNGGRAKAPARLTAGRSGARPAQKGALGPSGSGQAYSGNNGHTGRRRVSGTVAAGGRTLPGPSERAPAIETLGGAGAPDRFRPAHRVRAIQSGAET